MVDQRMKSKCLYTPNTKGIPLTDLTLIDDTASNLSKEINIDINDLHNKPFWFKYKGTYYYYKETTLAIRIINELLGQYLSEYMDLPTIKYDLCLNEENIIGLLSKNFREQGKEYINACDLSIIQYVYIDYLLRFGDRKNELRRKLINMITKDIFTCMIDRFANTLCIGGDHFDLAPLFDYEYSMSYRDINGNIRDDLEYQSPLLAKFPYTYHSLKAISDEEFKRMVKKDEQYREAAERMNALKMNDVLDTISDERGIFIPDDLREYYTDFYHDRQVALMKTLK